MKNKKQKNPNHWKKKLHIPRSLALLMSLWLTVIMSREVYLTFPHHRMKHSLSGWKASSGFFIANLATHQWSGQEVKRGLRAVHLEAGSWQLPQTLLLAQNPCKFQPYSVRLLKKGPLFSFSYQVRISSDPTNSFSKDITQTHSRCFT